MSSLLRSVTALSFAAAAGLAACDCGAPPGGGATLVLRFPEGTTLEADGVSTLRASITAFNAEGGPDTTPIEVTVSAGAIGAVGEAAVPERVTVTPNDQGVADVDFICPPLENATVTVAADNGVALPATGTLRCVQPQGDLRIEVNQGLCNGIQADGVSSCEVTLNVERDIPGDDDLPTATAVSVTVVNTNPPEGSPNVLSDSAAGIGTSSITVATDAEGAGSFFIRAPSEPVTVTVEITAEGTTAVSTVVIEEFAPETDVAFSPSPLAVVGGEAADVTISVLRPNGDPAASESITVRVPPGVDLLLSSPGSTPASDIEIVAPLDANGEVVVTVTSSDAVAELVQTELEVEYLPVLNGAPTIETVIVSINPPGALILSSTVNPATIDSDEVLDLARRVDVDLTLSVDGDVPADAQVVVTVPSDAISDIVIDGAGDELTLTAADFDANNSASFTATVTRGTPTQKVVLKITGSSVVEAQVAFADVEINVIRDPRVQEVRFESVTPTGPLGVRGGFLPASAVVSFIVRDDTGAPMPNVPVEFTANGTADPEISVSPNATSDLAGVASTVIATGTIPGPVTVVATASVAGIVRTGQSATLTIVGGLPSFETSFLECGPKADAAPYTLNCEAVLVDRFSNVADGLSVQFQAEGGNGSAFAEAAGGVAAVSIGSSATAVFNPLADVLGWSYGLAVPNSAANLTGFAGAAACFDGDQFTICDLVELCDLADDPALEPFCPLPAGCIGPGAATTPGEDAADLVITTVDPLDAVTDVDTIAAVASYVDHHRDCGFPVSCLRGVPGGLGLDLVSGDDCPVALGCLDFTTATECPQDGLRTIVAQTRGAEAFSDFNGNGAFDFTDANGNGRHDTGEVVNGDAFVDLPEPFLDRNDNCFRDDLTDNDRFQFTPIFKVVNTDQFADVDGDDEFGFLINGESRLTNAQWDADTQIFLTDHFMEIDDINFDFGEECNGFNQAVTCATGVNTTCDEQTAGGQHIATACGMPNLDTGTQAHTVAFRWRDDNGNCPSPDFALDATVSVEGKAKIAGDIDVALSAGTCGFIAVAAPIRPFCERLPVLGAPVFTATVTRDCGDDPTPVVEPATLTFTVGDVTETVGFTVSCP